MPWSVKCRLCSLPETIEHCFISCKDAFLFWDVLKRTLKKDLYVMPYSIRFLPVHPGVVVPHDLFILVGLHSLWGCRMIDRNDGHPRTTMSLFIEMITHVGNIYDFQGALPDWHGLLTKCTSLPDF